MDETTIRRLGDLNNAFYRVNHESFSSTRSSGWNGWDRACEQIEAGKRPVRVLDVACGNQRFERYAIERFPESSFEFTCIDSCPELVEPAPCVRFEHVDIIGKLLAREPLLTDFEPFDVAVAFGFMHHVPSAPLRESLLRFMLGCLVPGGTCIASFWRFHLDSDLKAKADKTTREGLAETGLLLEDGDYLLGWNGQRNTYRYCHSFSDGEIDQLIASVASEAECVDRFCADGKNGALNGYAVFRRQGASGL